jgi:hypothetical protein
MTIKSKGVSPTIQSTDIQRPAYSIQTVSRQVAIGTDSGDTIILTDPDITALEFPSWGDIADLAKKIKDLISTGPTFPTDNGGGKGDITIIIGDVSGGTIGITIPR